MIAITSVPAAKSKARADYLKFVERFPLRAIRSEADYKAAVAVIDKLAGFPNLSVGEDDYLDALASLIEQYEQSTGVVLEDVSPVEAIKSLMEHRGMTQADLAKMFGKTAASLMLRGERQVSRDQAKALATHFRVDAAIFL